MPPDPFLDRLTYALADVPGVTAIVLGGSRARETDKAERDYDIGLYDRTAVCLTARATMRACSPSTTSSMPAAAFSQESNSCCGRPGG